MSNKYDSWNDKGAKLNHIDELREHLMFNLELLLKADASYELYQRLLELHHNDKEKGFSRLLVIIIDSLVSNCIIITTRLIDRREKINIHNTIKNAINFYPEDKTLLSAHSDLENENERIKRLCDRRDKYYAHSDLENLNDSIASDYPYIREDLDLIIETCFKAVNAANSSVNGYMIGSFDKDSKKRVIYNTKLILLEIGKLEKVFSTHSKIY